MKFSQMPYSRPDVQAALAQMQSLTRDAANAPDGAALLAAFEAEQALGDTIDTMASIAHVRHTVDTRDDFYDAENDFWDETGPLINDRAREFHQAILRSPHRAALEAKHGKILLDKMELSVKAGDTRTVALQQEENALASRYDKLCAGARIPFRGEERTLPQMTPFKQDADRAVRKEATEAEGGFYDGRREELDDIYDKLVSNRTEQAAMLGYDRYTPLGDIRMERLGYTRADIALCREAVAKHVVPAVQAVKARQAKRIGVDALRGYDDAFCFKEGNPKPKGTPEEILAAGQAMYRAMSAETAEFIDFMMDNDLFDVLSKPGKAPGGYCTTFRDYRSPFIYSNFNGTAGDVDVLTHEAGHAFAAFRAMRAGLPAMLQMPGLESCEIHSMSMEFLTADYHNLFFREDTDRYALAHAEDALSFLPYGCQVDEFQQIVYDNPGLTPAGRNEAWAELDRKYRPWIDFSGLPFYGRGAGWQRQLHIYTSPFYYIDYVLAQLVALEFFLAGGRDKADAWGRYLALLNKAGAETYVGLVHAAGLRTPFEPGMVEAVVGGVGGWLKGHPLA